MNCNLFSPCSIKWTQIKERRLGEVTCFEEHFDMMLRPEIMASLEDGARGSYAQST